MKSSISEVDLLLYILAIERKYYELLEFYGMCHEYSVCPHCKKDTKLQSKIIKDVIQTFGDVGRIKVPKHYDLKQVTRDISIWSGLSKCDESGMSMQVEDYAKKYHVTPDNIYKIKNKVQLLVDKFLAMRTIFKKRQRDQ